jgi:tetratricopeptide (TPR) repeat protein
MSRAIPRGPRSTSGRAVHRTAGKLQAAALGLLLWTSAAAQTPKPAAATYDEAAYRAGRAALSQGDLDGAVARFCAMAQPLGGRPAWTVSLMVLCRRESVADEVAKAGAEPAFVQPAVLHDGTKCFRICAGFYTSRNAALGAARAMAHGAEGSPFPVPFGVACGGGEAAGPNPPEASGRHPAFLGPPDRQPPPSAGGAPSSGPAGPPAVQTPPDPAAPPEGQAAPPEKSAADSPEEPLLLIASPEGEAWFRKGLEAHREGRRAEAEADYRRALQDDPGRPEVLNNLGVLYLESGRYAQAESVLRKALERSSRYPNAHQNLAGALWGQGRHEEALAEARKAVEADPSDVGALLTVASFARLSGKPEEAAAAARKALVLEPENARAKAILEATEGKR